MNKAITQAAQAIAQADAIYITAGAGMGVDSGLPDFRGNDGFWQAYPLLKKENILFYDLANPKWFKDDPYRAWWFYGHRFNLYKKTKPHKGFDILKKWSNSKKVKSFVFTSNVDGHFLTAGFPASSIYECHGSINFLQCSQNCTDKIWQLNSLDLTIDNNSLTSSGNLPKCPKCRSVARPNIQMFDDYYWLPQRSNLQEELLMAWEIKVSGLKVVTIELGAGVTIPTVRMESERMSGKLVRINPRDSRVGGNDISIKMNAFKVLGLIDDLL